MEEREFEQLLSKWRKDGLSVIDCIRRLREEHGLSMTEAKKIVHFSATWADVRVDHERFQEDLETAVRSLPQLLSGRVESVNIGREQAIPGHPRMGGTGIYKAPVDGPVRIEKLSVEGDCVFDQKHHGGPDQAVYVYLSEDYDWWSKTLGRKIAPGTFGDNITISGLTSADLAIGDRLIAGDVVIEVTTPRIPCSTLAARMNDSGFVKAYRDAGRPGAYCRVISEGEVRAGMDVIHQPYAGNRITLNSMFRDWFVRKTLGVARLKETLAAPIGARARKDCEELLAAAEAR